MKRLPHTSWIGAMILALAVITLSSSRVGAAELPTVEVGLPQDGLFGLGGQYILDKGLDRQNGFSMKPRWAPVPEVQRLLGIQAIPVGLMPPGRRFAPISGESRSA